jgi:hypothetical protein
MIAAATHGNNFGETDEFLKNLRNCIAEPRRLRQTRADSISDLSRRDIAEHSETFLCKHARGIGLAGVLSCYDRIVIRGTFAGRVLCRWHDQAVAEQADPLRPRCAIGSARRRRQSRARPK